MRRILVLAVAAATCGITIAACSGGGKKGASGHGELSTGDYAISNSAVVEDGCGLGLDATQIDGGQIAITIAGGTFSFPVTQAGDLATGPYSAGVFDAKYNTDIDFSPTYDCVVTEDYGYAGASTAVDAADATETIAVKVKSGAGCAALAADLSAQSGITVTFPCSSKDTQHITKLPPPEIVSGTLTTSTGYGTTLSNDYFSESTSSTLTASVLASGLTFTLADNFQCYSPTATAATYYELGTYIPGNFTLHIDSAGWMNGSVSIDGTTNTLDLDLVDSAGNELVASATGGSVNLVAPLTTTGMCSFGASAVPLTGTLTHPAFDAPSTHKRHLNLGTKSWKLETQGKALKTRH